MCRLLEKVKFLPFSRIYSPSCYSPPAIPVIPQLLVIPAASRSREIAWNCRNPGFLTYLLVSRPTQGLTSSWTRALEAKSSPTRVFSWARNSPPSRQPLGGVWGVLGGCPGGLLPVLFGSSAALVKPRTGTVVLSK